MTQNVFGPPSATIFQATRYQGEFVTLNDVSEIVFSYSGPVAANRQSGFWVPVRRSTLVQLVASMRDPKPVNILETSSVGDIANFVFGSNPTVYGLRNTVPAGAAGGWIRTDVGVGANALGGEDLVVMLRYIEVS